MTKKATYTELDILASLCRESFKDFVKDFWSTIITDTLVWNWHMDVLCDELQKVAERIFKGLPREYDLIINVPPATTKSSIASVMFPAWIWTRMPHCRVIGASYSYSLAVDLSRKSRDVIKSDKYMKCFPEVRIRDDQDTKGFYLNTKHGDRFTASVNGMVTGMHGHIILVDDPLDPEQSFSEAELRIANRWMTHTLPSRKVDKSIAPIILIQQRLHSNDPTGEMLEKAKRQGAFPIRHIRIPADNSFPIHPPELAEKYCNGLMDPKRLPQSVLDAERANSEYSYRCQYGQDPQPSGGTMFKLEYFTNLVKAAPYKCIRIRYWDRACLVGSTAISTSRGEIPICKVKVGDYVLTRSGYKKVLWSGISKHVNKSDLVTAILPNGRILTGTGDHKVWTDNRCWVPLELVTTQDYIVINSNSSEVVRWESAKGLNVIRKPSLLSSTALPTVRSLGITKLIDGIKYLRSTGRIPFIEQFGDLIMVKYLKGIISTIKIRTVKITISQIWNACHQKSMQHNTQKRLDILGRMLIPLISLSACNAYESIWQTDPILPFTVLCAENLNKRDTSIQVVSNTAHSDADKEVTLVPVFDLEVEDAHEFFANGVLVHNSTSSASANATTAAFTAGVLMAKSEEGSYFIEHVVHGQWEPDERNRVMKATAERDRAKYGENQPVVWVEREGGSSGRDAWKGVVRSLAGFVVKEDTVTGRKEVRAEPWACQMAAGNVYLVSDGTWDIARYIDEHCLFPNGRLKDLVDSSTGAFNLLTNVKKIQPLRVIKLMPRERRKTLRVIVCTEEELPYIHSDSLLLVSLGDRGHENAPSCDLAAESLALGFPNLDPALLQDRWLEKVEAYNDLPENLVLRKEQAKLIWRFLFKKRDIIPKDIVVVEKETTDRAMSVGLAICDAFRLPRETTLIVPGGFDKINEAVAPNRHVYTVVRSSRATVVE